MMTRKDYEMLARAIREDGSSISDRRSLADRLADELKSDNPRFDRDRFIRAALPEMYPPEH